MLEYMDAVCVSIQGFMNALVWLSDPYFRSRMKQAPICLRIMVITYNLFIIINENFKLTNYFSSIVL